VVESEFEREEFERELVEKVLAEEHAGEDAAVESADAIQAADDADAHEKYEADAEQVGD
jgi:hypothetical protein